MRRLSLFAALLALAATPAMAQFSTGGMTLRPHFVGVSWSIDNTTVNNYLTLQLMDPTNAYSIEEKTIILMTSVQQSFPI